MRIAFYGNTCNNFYATCKALRAKGLIDAHLYIDHDADMLQAPESDDASLKNNYPNWIHKGRYRSGLSAIFPFLSPLVREFKNYDLVFVSGGGVRFAPFVKKPFVFYATGWDLTVSPFPIRFFFRPPGIFRKLGNFIGGIWQRIGLHAVSEIWSQPFYPFELAIQKLKLNRTKIVPGYFPIMIDTEMFNPEKAMPIDQQAEKIRRESDFVIFHPSRLMMNRASRFRDTGQWKGNDKLFEGIALLKQRRPEIRVSLVMPDRGISSESTEAINLIQQLKISDSIRWIKPPQGNLFTREQLLPFYASADCVVDEFGIGWFGSIVVEGLSMAKPVLCFLDQPTMNKLYSWHPILSPETPLEISQCLEQLIDKKDERLKRGQEGRRWAVEFHSFDQASERYVAQIQLLAERSTRDQLHGNA